MNDRPSGENTFAPSRDDSKKSENASSPRLCGIERFERATSAEVERHLPIVRKMIELYGYGDALSYEEKLATGLIGVAIAIEKFDPSRNVKFAYWLSYQIDKAIRNESRLVLRQRGRGVQPFEEDFDPIDENEWQARTSSEEREERRELAALAVAALETLDPRSRRVVKALCFDGKTQEEIAKELGVSQSWTSRLARAAFKKLRREVERRSAAARA